MRAADEFGKGFLTRTQMAYAAISYWFHQERPADLTARLREPDASATAWSQLLPDTHFHAGFGHLEGYTSAYYTYMWSPGDREGPVHAPSTPTTCSPPRWRTATATPCWRRAARRTPPTWSRTSSAAPTTPGLHAPGSSAHPEAVAGEPTRPAVLPHVALSQHAHDRHGLLRTDEAWLDERWADPATRVLVIAGARLRPVDGRIAWVSPDGGARRACACCSASATASSTSR